MNLITPDDLISERTGLSEKAITIINKMIRENWDGTKSTFSELTLRYLLYKEISIGEVEYILNSFEKAYIKVGWIIEKEKINDKFLLLNRYTFTKA